MVQMGKNEKPQRLCCLDVIQEEKTLKEAMR